MKLQLRKLVVKLFSFIRLHYPLWLLLVMTSIVNYRWFTGKIFSYGDWPYIFSDGLSKYTELSLWNSASGGLDAIAWRLPLNATLGLLSELGLNYETIVMLAVLVPTVIGMATAGYFLGYNLTRSRLGGFITGIIISFNSYLIASNSQGHILLLTATPFAIFGFLTFIRILRRNDKWFVSVLSGLLLAIAGWIDFRILYVTAWLCVFYLIAWFFVGFIRKTSSRHHYLSALRASLVVVLTVAVSNLFWIIPTVLSASSIGSDVLSRSLFGNEYWNLSSAITLNHPFWTGTTTNWFTAQGVRIIDWVVPIFFVAGLYYAILKRNMKIIFFGIIGIIGVFLSKQVDVPLSFVYEWLFTNIPGFGAFREATKFYFLSVIGYSIVIAYFLASIRKDRFLLKMVLTVIVIFPFILNAHSILLGNVGGLYASRDLPLEYAELNSKFASEKKYFKTLWLPTGSNWQVNGLLYPRINGTVINSSWKNYQSFSETASAEDYFVERWTSLLTQPIGEVLLTKNAVKYVVVPSDLSSIEGNLYQYYGYERDRYIEMLDSIPYLRKVSDINARISVYENLSYSGYVTTNKLGLAVTPNESTPNFVNTLGEFTDPSKYAFSQGENTHGEDVFDLSHEKNLKPTETSGRYAITNPRINYGYIITQDKLQIVRRDLSPTITPTSLIVNPDISSVIYDQNYDPTKNYYLHSEENTTELSAKNSLSFTNVDKPNLLELYESSAETLQLLENMDRESVYCNESSLPSELPLDSESLIKTDALSLTAKRQPVCGQIGHYNVYPSTDYVLSFKYVNSASQRVAIITQDSEGNSKEHLIPVSAGTREGRLSILLRTGSNARYMKVALKTYPPDDRRGQSTTKYFDLSMRAVKKIAQFKESSSPQINELSNKLSIIGSLQDSNNLLTNGDFESSLWQDKVSDCHDFDSNPSIGMEKIDTGINGKSLKLWSNWHVACTKSMPIKISGGQDARISFDFTQNRKGSAGYSVTFDSRSYVNYSERMDTLGEKSKQHFEKVISTPKDATVAYITFYSYPGDNMKERREAVYDNVKLQSTAINRNNIWIINQRLKDSISNGHKTPSAHHIMTSNTTHSVELENNPGKDIVITAADRYNSNWMFTNPNQKVNPFNDLGNNAWVLNDSSSKLLSGSLEFTPQRYVSIPFHLGVALPSILILVGLTVYWVRSKR